MHTVDSVPRKPLWAVSERSSLAGVPGSRTGPLRFSDRDGFTASGTGVPRRRPGCLPAQQNFKSRKSTGRDGQEKCTRDVVKGRVRKKKERERGDRCLTKVVQGSIRLPSRR